MIIPLMADIRGFRGIRYKSSEKDLSRKFAPPYDVIDEKHRETLLRSDDKNCVQLILPEGGVGSKYKTANETLKNWLEDGTLKRDLEVSIYRVHQIYTHEACGSAPVTRKGFIAAVKLHDFDEKIVRRHELTLKGPKIDRLNLWKETDCHLSQIFSLYRDKERIIDELFLDIEKSAPDFEGTTDDGTHHKCWCVSDSSLLKQVSGHLRGKPLYIADGHHRYETMLALRNLKREAKPSLEDDAHEYGMMFLSNVDDPGLVVLPTHRLIHGVSGLDQKAFKKELEEAFDVSVYKRNDSSLEALRLKIKEESKHGPSFGCVFPKQNDVLIASLKKGSDLKKCGLGDEEVLYALDVHVLHTLVLEKILGIDKKAQEAKTNIYYIRKLGDALNRTDDGEGQVCFIMNDSPVQQMVDVSDKGLVMPQKSTFFYPKVATGTVFYPLS